MMNKKIRIAGILAVSVVIYLWFSDEESGNIRQEFTGITMGAIPYAVKIIHHQSLDIQFEIDSLLDAFNQSLSNYIPNSEISQFNKNHQLEYESRLFYPVLAASREVVRSTNGAFDPTIGPLVNAWGFGPGGVPTLPDSAVIDSLRSWVGFDKIRFDERKAEKPAGVYLDFSAIAKGYAVDGVAEYMEKKGIQNYLVEIGGELRVKGLNARGEWWSVGIDDPLVGKEDRRIFAIVALHNQSVATSGNYRNYYEKDGRLVAHIIDPRTGYNNFNGMLSASVFAPDCMTADAYATAFMVTGTQQSMELLAETDDLEAILIYRDEDQVRSYVTSGIKERVKFTGTDAVP